MKRIDFRGRPPGSALVTVLLLILVFSVLGTTALWMTGTDLKIGTNAQQNLEALYAAEAGLQSLLAFYQRQPEAFLQKKTGSLLGLPSVEPAQANWRQFRVWAAELRYDGLPVPRFAELTVQAREPRSRASARIKATLFRDSPDGRTVLAEPFTIGLLTGGPLDLGALVRLQTDGHANGGYSVDSALKERLRKDGFSLSQSFDPAGPDYRESVGLPRPTEEELEYFRTLARAGDRYYRGENRALSLRGDQQGQLVFVEGDALVEGIDLSGVTLVSTGSITFTGNSRVNAEQFIDVAFIALKDIVLKNNGEAAGVYWCQGSFQPQGPGGIEGIIVSRGGISSAGPFSFSRYGQIQNPYLPPAPQGQRWVWKGWLQF